MSMFALTVFAGEPVQTTTTTPTIKSISKVLTKKAKRQLKVLAPAQASNFLDSNNDDYGPPDSDDLDMHRAYNRPKLIAVTQDNFNISPMVAARLRLARQRAIEKHKEIWAI